MISNNFLTQATETSREQTVCHPQEETRLKNHNAFCSDFFKCVICVDHSQSWLAGEYLILLATPAALQHRQHKVSLVLGLYLWYWETAKCNETSTSHLVCVIVSLLRQISV